MRIDWIGNAGWRRWWGRWNSKACRYTILHRGDEYIIIDDPDGETYEVSSDHPALGRFPTLEAAKVAYVARAYAEGLI